LLDLTAAALRKNPELTSFEGHVSDSSEGALFGRFESRGIAEYADKLLSAMRYEFGGHVEKSGKQGDH
jgi:6-phosphogluconate dehydrogenase